MTNAVAILGAGAVGQLIFHQLSGDNASSPMLIARRPLTSNQQRLEYTDLQGVSTSCNATVANINSIKTLPTTQLVIVCVKAYQVVDSIATILPKLAPNCHILLLNNGLGPHLAIDRYLAAHGVSIGTTSQGVLKQGRWQISQTGTGITELGDYSGQPMSAELKQWLLAKIPDSRWCRPILPQLWQKLAINAIINPLSAIYNCPNGQLDAPQYRQQIQGLIDEVWLTAQAENITLDKPKLIQRVFEVIKLTARNYSSMHQDIHRQRKTEIDAISGYVLQRANHHQIDVPYTKNIYNRLIKLEKNHLI